MTDKESMLGMFIFETLQLIEQLEQSILDGEKSDGIQSSINEIFRIMHTIKGSSGMMLFDEISILAHSMEDLFYHIREKNPQIIDYTQLTDIVLECIDFIKVEIAKLENGYDCDGDSSGLTQRITEYLCNLKSANSFPASADPAFFPGPIGKTASESTKAGSDELAAYHVLIFFEEDCGMENIRAFEVVHKLAEIASDITHIPEELFNDEKCADKIKTVGFQISFSTDRSREDIEKLLSGTVLLKRYALDPAKDTGIAGQKQQNTINLGESDNESGNRRQESNKTNGHSAAIPQHNYISVGVSKLDVLMDVVGELVISEALVTQHPELVNLPLNDFYKAARQLRKITNELQDIVMSIRMVSLSATFQKMNRLVRDMSKKLGKEVHLKILGEETEVDKNIIEHISDPLMHLIRNAIDHGIESTEERIAVGKPKTGTITLEARNAGGEVWISVKDDGRGLNKEKILKKARENGLLQKPEEEITEKEIYSFIFHPGFSTKENVTEFSGRGVGMDVVSKNIDQVRGTVTVESSPGTGTSFIIKIPLTLAIIDGINVQVGNSKYTLPTLSIKESFKVKADEVVKDNSGNEMILVRGECLPIIRLHKLYNTKTSVTDISKGILTLVENGSRNICLFSDSLLGEQQVVVKALPNYIKKVRGVAGCTLLGDGNISLILDIPGLINSVL